MANKQQAIMSLIRLQSMGIREDQMLNMDLLLAAVQCTTRNATWLIILFGINNGTDEEGVKTRQKIFFAKA